MGKDKKDRKESIEGLRHEYAEVNLNFRHYSALRFAILTVFFAILGAISMVAFGLTSNTSPMITRIAKIGGLLITSLFFVYEFVIQKYIRHFGDMAQNLEEKLGYQQLTKRPRDKTIRLQYLATYAFYFVLFCTWLLSLFFL
jgi:hypothetical protein